MLLPNQSIIQQLQLITSAFILLTSFLFLTQKRISSLINTFAWQSGLLVVITILQAMATSNYELYLSAGLTLILKVMFVPKLMRYLVTKLNIRHNVAVINHPFILLSLAVTLVLFCFRLSTIINHVTAIAMAVTLLGMLLLITHRKAISHVIGFMSMENGIFFAALITANGMPIAVELGIAFDVLVATILFGVFFFHIRSSIESLDVDRLNLLREDLK
jgi:hydrogenase-4 component E